MRQPVSPWQFVNLLSAPPDVSAAWNPFVLQRIDAPQHLKATTFADHVLGLHISGVHRLRHVFGGRVSEGRSDPGAVHLVPAGVDLTVDSTAPSRALVLFIPDAFLSRVITEHWEADPRRVELVRQFLVRDRVVDSVMTDLELEALHGAPLGRLYAESACEFLAHHIIHAYSSIAGRVAHARGGLSGHRLKRVTDYIHDNLGGSISLRDLAKVAGLSVRHFERAFRDAIGMPPHAYVTDRRIAAARELLVTDRHLTVEVIAKRVGFTSSSHLATAFRRRIGYSPTTFRALGGQRSTNRGGE